MGSINKWGIVASAGLKRRCPSCLHPLKSSSVETNFCTNCGYPLRADSWDRRPADGEG